MFADSREGQSYLSHKIAPVQRTPRRITLSGALTVMLSLATLFLVIATEARMSPAERAQLFDSTEAMP